MIELAPRSFVGIDNGVTGAVAVIHYTGAVDFWPTPTRSTGGDTRIDARALSALLAGLTNPHVVYEQGQKQPKFGTKGNFANGRSDGVLETVIELLLTVPYLPVNPKTWQSVVFKDMRRADADTKAAAIEFCRRTFPTLDLLRTPRCKGADPNIADALCMAWWAKHHAFPN